MTTQQRRDTLSAAILAELAAYATMRGLVPDLAKPHAVRAPLTRRQQSAVDDYAAARERLRLARQAEPVDLPLATH